MALKQTDLVGSKTFQTDNLRFVPFEDGIQPGTLAAISGAPSLAHGTPLAHDGTDWIVWSAAENAEYTITADATPASGGDFTLTFNGETTAVIAFDATAADVQAAIEALGQVDIGDVTAVQTVGTDLGDANAVVTITFGGNLAGVDVNGTADFSGLTGNAHVLAETTEGGDAAASKIKGFLWTPLSAHASDASDETTIQVFKRGRVDRDDVPVPSGETQGDLDTALKQLALREAGITVTGLAGVQ